MIQTLYGRDKEVIKFVGERVDENDFGSAIGIGQYKDGKIIAGVVYNLYNGPSICMHVAAEPGTRWLTRDFLFRVFAYPFIQLGCNRVTGLVRTDNMEARRFDEHLGFKQEGVIRKGASDGTDMILYGMLMEECRWLELKDEIKRPL
jgi:RimJ/RimL family protein N-acetyltransferase